MSIVYILGSWTILLLTALYYLGLLGGGNRVVNESTSTKESTKSVDSDTIAKAKKKYAKKKRKKKKRQEKKQPAVVNKEQVGINQEEKPDSVPEIKEKSQTPKTPREQAQISHDNKSKTIPYQTKEHEAEETSTVPLQTKQTKTIPYQIQETKPIPYQIYTPTQYAAPVDDTSFAPPATSYEFNQVAPTPQTKDATAPLVNDDALYMPGTSPQVIEPEEEQPQDIASEDDEAPIEELGGDWFAYKSTEYGLPYYHNVRTLETVWDRPVVEPQIQEEPEAVEPEIEQSDTSQLDQKLNSPVQGSPTSQQHIPTMQPQQHIPAMQQPYMGQPNSFSPQRSTLSRPTTFAEKLRLAKLKRSQAAVPRLIVRTPQKKAPVAAVPPPEYTMMQMPQNTDTSSWATVSAKPALPRKLITTQPKWVKVGSNVPPEPVAKKKKGPPTLAEQLQAFKTALMQARVAKKWKQSELAKRLDIRPQEFSKYEQGKEVPSHALINKMTRLLGVKLPRVKKPKMKETQPLQDD